MEFETHFIFTELFVSICILVLILSEIYIRVDSKGSVLIYNEVITKGFVPGSLLLMLVVGYGMLTVGSIIDLRTWDEEPIVYLFENNLVFTELGQNMKMLIILLVFIYLSILMCYRVKLVLSSKNISLIIIMIYILLFGCLMVISSNDLILMFISFEVVSISLYVIAGIVVGSAFKSELLWKYFISSCFFFLIGMYGISLIYSVGGTTKLDQLTILMAVEGWNSYFFFGFFFINSYLFFKLGVFPFHFWMNYVYNKEFFLFIIFLTLAPKVIYVYICWKLFIISKILVQGLFIVVGLLSVVAGAFMCLYESNMIKLFGWSSMIHMGHILLSISVGSVEGYLAAFIYLIVYIFLQLFCYLFMMSFNLHEKGYIEYLDNISNIHYIYKSSKLLTMCFMMILLSMNGLPFFAGFFSKWYVFSSLIGVKSYTICIILFVFNTIGLVYNLRLIRYLVMVENENPDKFVKLDGRPFIRVLLMVIILLNICFFLLHPYMYMYLKTLILSLPL